MDDMALRLCKAIIYYVLKKSIRIMIYVTENFENLFDYTQVFEELSRTNYIKIGDILVNVSLFDVFAAFPAVAPAGNMKNVVIVAGLDFINAQNPAEAQIVQNVNSLLMNAMRDESLHVIVLTTSPMMVVQNVPLLKYATVKYDVVPTLVAKWDKRKEFYAKVVGFLKVLSMEPEQLAEYVKTRILPTPHTVQYIRRPVKDFGDLVLDPWLRNFLKTNVLVPLQQGATDLLASVMFIGPPGVGKTTIAYAIARTLGIKAVAILTELMSSKWLGESEKTADQTMMAVNDMAPVVVALRNFEVMLGGGEHSPQAGNVYARMKNIIVSWIRSPRRRFFAVLTVSNPKALKEQDIFEPALGTYKIPILPPMEVENRRKLLVRFIRRYAKRFDKEFDPDNPKVSEALDEVAETTFGYTARELEDIAKIAINITLEKALNAVTREAILLARHNKTIDLAARADIMKKTIDVTMKVGVTDDALSAMSKFQKELEGIKLTYLREEKRKKKYAKITT